MEGDFARTANRVSEGKEHKEICQIGQNVMSDFYYELQGGRKQNKAVEFIALHFLTPQRTTST